MKTISNMLGTLAFAALAGCSQEAENQEKSVITTLSPDYWRTACEATTPLAIEELGSSFSSVLVYINKEGLAVGYKLEKAFETTSLRGKFAPVVTNIGSNPETAIAKLQIYRRDEIFQKSFSSPSKTGWRMEDVLVSGLDADLQPTNNQHTYSIPNPTTSSATWGHTTAHSGDIACKTTKVSN